MRMDGIWPMVGHTPMVRLRHLSDETGALVLGKLESRNPSGSIKDRLVQGLIEAERAEGRLGPGATVVVASAGNTAIAAAALCAAGGLACVVVAPEAAGGDWRRLVEGIGASVITTPGRDGMGGASRRAQHEAANRPQATLLSPFADERALAAYAGLAEEIWQDTDGRLARIVTGVGTGASAAGLMRVLRPRAADLTLVAVEPEEAPNLSGGSLRPHRIAGIGVGFVPAHWAAVGPAAIDAVSTADAWRECRRLATTEGLLVGPSGGAAAAAARRTARRGEVCVVILADSGERYLSQPGFVAVDDEGGGGNAARAGTGA